MDMLKQQYVGDGVYAGFDGHYIWLWLDDGIAKSKPIALEDDVYNSLIDFAAQCWNMTASGKAVP